jgi:hypothetical protein
LSKIMTSTYHFLDETLGDEAMDLCKEIIERKIRNRGLRCFCGDLRVTVILSDPGEVKFDATVACSCKNLLDVTFPFSLA